MNRLALYIFIIPMPSEIYSNVATGFLTRVDISPLPHWLAVTGLVRNCTLPAALESTRKQPWHLPGLASQLSTLQMLKSEAFGTVPKRAARLRQVPNTASSLLNLALPQKRAYYTRWNLPRRSPVVLGTT